MMNNNDRPFVRWQEIRIEQLGYVNYTLLILCSAIFAFQSDVIIKNELINSMEKYLFLQSIVFIFISIVIGCLLAFNRLISFKITAKIARIKEKEGYRYLTLNYYRKITKIFDSLTWILISLQLIFFLFGICKLLLFVLN